MVGDKVADSPSGNELEPGAALGPTTPTPPAESIRAFQGSVDSAVEREFSSIIGDSGLRGGEAPGTSGSPEEDEISGLQMNMAGEHLDQEKGKALSEGDAAVKPVSPDKMIPNVEGSGISAAEELVVDGASGSQEVIPEKEIGNNTLDVSVDGSSSFIANATTVQEKGESSGVAENTVDLPDKREEAGAWSTNEVRASVPMKTWSADGARVEAHEVSCSADDCNNGAQVSVVANDGGSQVDAPVQPEVGGVEQNDEGHTGANGAAVMDGGESPLVTMEPKDPTVEESVPAVDDKPKDPTVEESMPAVDDKSKDPVEGGLSNEMEIAPTGGLLEVDTKQTTTGEAEPLAKAENMVEAGGVQGPEESMPASVRKKSEVPNEVLPASHGKRSYQKGDTLDGTVYRITAEGVYLDYEDLNVLIPVKGKDASQFWIGDTVQALVQEVKEDGTLILDTYLELEDDVNEVASTELRKWKNSSSGMWWNDSWYDGQWDQKSSYGQWNWTEEEWQCYGWSANEWVSPEDWEEGVQKQLYGERIYRVLLGNALTDKEYLGKITGMLLDRRLEEVKELVANSAQIENEAHGAYNVLLSEGWTPDGQEDAGWKRGSYSRDQYHNALFDLARQRRMHSEAATGEAVAKIMDKGDDEFWYELRLDSLKFLQELDEMVEAMRQKEGRPIEDYLDPSKVKKVYLTPKPLSKGYTKLCRFYNQGTCRNGDECTYEHRRYGEGWPTRCPAESETSNNAGDEEGDIGGPPTDEGVVDDAQEEREDAAFRAKFNFGKGASKGGPTLVESKNSCVCIMEPRVMAVNMDLPASSFMMTMLS